MKTLTLLLTTLALCIPVPPAFAQATGRSSSEPPAATGSIAPRPITYPAGYRRALALGTRAPSGQPGARYWQQWTEYDMRARIEPEAKRLRGSATIRYHNNSPDTLSELYLQLSQNLHSPGVPKSRPQEITGGVDVELVEVGGRRLESGAGYEIDGTVMRVTPPRPIGPGQVETIRIEYAFAIPRAGASRRMGWSEDNLLFLAYWYPQMAVYNDVVGWQRDPFTGTSEFYAGFGRYDVRVEAPTGWLVIATGQLLNADDVLAPGVIERLRRAETSDEIVPVVSAGDLSSGGLTRSTNAATLTWRFVADSVRDFAFSVSRESLWDAARTPVGDRDGDGDTDYTRVDAIYRANAPRWKQSARYSQDAIEFLSRFTGVPYPWPHMTAVEGGGIISGGMEFPMVTLIGDYNERSDTALYRVTAHELAHMWVPMTVNTDERRYSWMDEGTTRFNGYEAVKAYYPGHDPGVNSREAYLAAAAAEDEGEIMRWSDHHYTYDQYRMASYSKPEVLLGLLRSLLGEETFLRAYHTYLRSWAFKHPYPWDFFNTVETVSGQDLDWFWRSWYYETWVLDQAIAAVEREPGGTRVTVRNLGDAVMPVRLRVQRADRTETWIVIPVAAWLNGADVASVVVPGGPVEAVSIDPTASFPDVDRSNNEWRR